MWHKKIALVTTFVLISGGVLAMASCYPPGLTPVEELHITGSPPDVDISEYRLITDGLVEPPLALTYEQVMDYPTVTEAVLLRCPG
ncbi:hypothetical protein ACFLX5_02965 [Chloroflexota bacterium]